MTIDLNSHSGPRYRQIAEALRSKILNGELPPGSELPSVRSLAEGLNVSTLTVHQAYSVLRHSGLVESEPRKWTRVAPILSVDVGKDVLKRIQDNGPAIGYETIADGASVRSMASSIGDPTFFQSDEFFAEFFERQCVDPWNFYYAEPGGEPSLLSEISNASTFDGICSKPTDLIATEGSLSAISMLLEVLAAPGSAVLIQEPGRLWLPELLKHRRVSGVPIPMSGDSLDLDHLKFHATSLNTSVMLLAPDFGHVTGCVMPDCDREACIRIAYDNNMTILEDGALNAVHFGPRPVPLTLAAPLISCFIGSFSYSLSPGLKLGYVSVPQFIRGSLTALISATGQSGSRFFQRALARYFGSGAFEAHLNRTIPKYQVRRNAMVSALTASMPRSVSWTNPTGGFSTWLTLPKELSSSALYEQALKSGIAFAPGKLFLTTGDSENHLRLSFGSLPA